MNRRTSLVRGIVALAVLGALAGAMIASPVGAAAPLTKAKVKKIAKKEATKVFNSKLGTAKAGDADKLDGLDSAAFQQTDDLMFAVVSGAGGGSVALVRGRGATGVAAFLVTDVSFNQPVNDCAWTVTVEQPSQADSTFATTEIGGDNNVVRVTIWDDAGAAQVGDIFHLVVLCP